MAKWYEKEINKKEEESSLELLSSCLVPKVKQNNQLPGGGYFFQFGHHGQDPLDVCSLQAFTDAVCLSFSHLIIHCVNVTKESVCNKPRVPQTVIFLFSFKSITMKP